MTPILIGIVLAFLIIIFIEFLKLNRTIISALLVAGISFIYVGFASDNLIMLTIESLQAVLFFLIAYYGLTKTKKLLWIALFAHGLWDFGHLFFNEYDITPNGYEVFCISVDWVLAIYFYIKSKTEN